MKVVAASFMATISAASLPSRHAGKPPPVPAQTTLPPINTKILAANCEFCIRSYVICERAAVRFTHSQCRRPRLLLRLVRHKHQAGARLSVRSDRRQFPKTASRRRLLQGGSRLVARWECDYPGEIESRF